MEKIKEYIMIGLAALITIGYFATLFYLIYEKSYESTINLTIGTLLTAFGTIVGYFFGSSKGSAEKNTLINNK
jgi:hypothetical protein